MKVGDTQSLYKKKKIRKDFLTVTSPIRNDVTEPKPLCIAINCLPEGVTSRSRFRTRIYLECFWGQKILTKKDEKNLLIAKFQFIVRTINHNISIASTNGSNVLLENVKDSINRQILLTKIKVFEQTPNLNNSDDFKNLMIKVIDPDSNEKINNIKSLACVLDEIRHNELCDDNMINTLTQLYEKCVCQSLNTIKALQNNTITVGDLFESHASNIK